MVWKSKFNICEMTEAERLQLRESYIHRIVGEIGKRIGTEESRKSFAEDILNSLAYDLPNARRAPMEKGASEYILESLELILKGFRKLVKQYTSNGSIIYRKIYDAGQPAWSALADASYHYLHLEKITKDGVKKVCDEEALDVIENFIERFKESLENIPQKKTKPGRNISGSFIITDRVAHLWVKHFNRLPTPSDSKSDSPYSRACVVVAGLLKDLGNPDYVLPTSKTAQLNAIEKARKLHRRTPTKKSVKKLPCP